jgi:tetratricopeptide (TPR) repeat protein
MKALANDPAVRYPSARDFANELILFRSGGLDLDVETRRTHAPAPAHDPRDADATRRTRTPSAATVPTSAAPRRWGSKPQAATPQKRTLFSKFARFTALLALACVLYGGWSILSFVGLRGRAAQLSRQIKSEQLTDPDQVFARWNELAKSNPASLALTGTRGAVENNLVSAANLTIARFRDDTAVVNEKDWQRAATLLSHALEVDPDNDAARGDLRLCEGHVARMEGARHHDADQLTLAAEKFVQAQKLLPRSPDPELGLALLYIYGFRDIDKADAALQQAAHLGYQFGNREKAELADGYRDRADRLFKDTMNVRGLPQEKDQLSRAADDYTRALNLYQAIVPYNNAAMNVRRVEVSLDGVTARLQEIQQWQ